MPATNQYDDLFDAWGRSFNVDPQLAKSIFQMESGSGTTNPNNPMGIQPATAAAVAQKMGWDPKAVNLADMGWAVPIAARVLADGLTATHSADGAAGYYNSGSTDPRKWNQNYLATVGKIYPTAILSLSVPQGAPGGPDEGQGATTPPPAQQPAPASSGGPETAPPATPASSSSESPPAKGLAIVSTTASLMGKDSSTIQPFFDATGQTLDPKQGNWCAAFVNGVLNANGIQGTRGWSRNVATGFLKWGEGVAGDPQAGDVLVMPRGHPAGGVGGHVGFATGAVAEGPSGQRYYLMQSGNYADQVAYSWEPAQSLVVRRAPQLQAQAGN